MITALIITVTVAIIFIALFIDERGSTHEYREEIKSQKERIRSLEETAYTPVVSSSTVTQGRVDDQDLWDLTPDLVADVVKYNGYVPDKKEDAVFFMVQGERYVVPTDRLPYLLVMKRFSIDKEKYDIVLLRQAAAKTTDARLIGKVSVSDDGGVLCFFVSAIEPKYGHFRDVFNEYVSIINDLENMFGETYNQMVNDREEISKLEANGIPIEAVSNREGKIVS